MAGIVRSRYQPIKCQSLISTNVKYFKNPNSMFESNISILWWVSGLTEMYDFIVTLVVYINSS